MVTTTVSLLLFVVWVRSRRSCKFEFRFFIRYKIYLRYKIYFVKNNETRMYFARCDGTIEIERCTNRYLLTTLCEVTWRVRLNSIDCELPNDPPPVPLTVWGGSCSWCFLGRGHLVLQEKPRAAYRTSSVCTRWLQKNRYIW